MMQLDTLTWTEQDEDIFQLMDEMRDPEPGTPSPRGVLALIGDTQCGKSRLVSHWAHERHHEQIVYWNPQTDTPEDIGGFPHREKGIVRWTQPSIIPPEVMNKKGGWVLFIDELDKAQEEVLSCALTLLSERRIREFSVTPSAIVCAMNVPKRALPAPLMARLLFVPYPPQGYNVFARKDLAGVSHILSDVILPPEPVIPSLPSTYGGAHRLQHWMSTSDVFWKNTYVQQAVVAGSFAANHASSILGRLKDTTAQPAEKWATDSDAAEVAIGLITVLHGLNNRKLKANPTMLTSEVKVLEILTQRARDGVTGEMGHALDAFYNTPKALIAVERGASEELVAAGRAAMTEKWRRIQREAPQKKGE